jgi:tetratricopeptide (TPR) repeat protein
VSLTVSALDGPGSLGCPWGEIDHSGLTSLTPCLVSAHHGYVIISPPGRGNAARVMQSKSKIAFGVIIAFMSLACLVSVASAQDMKTLYQLYQQHYNAGEFSEALPLAQRMVEHAERQGGRNLPGYATTLNNLAMVYSALGRLPDAERLTPKLLRSGRGHFQQTIGVSHFLSTISRS